MVNYDKSSVAFNRVLAVAPMLDWTDRHFRYFLRMISYHTFLYSEMITTQAILYGDRERLLAFNPEEKPLALQLGGSCPKSLARCAAIAEAWGYDEVNLNVGCPSDRVRKGRFGACLMKEPSLVAECVAAMKAKTSLPVTVKCRIGVDDRDSYEALANFIETVALAGCTTFVVHARKAWLTGLSPKDNRTIPPLSYDLVFRLKQDFPELTFILNGGIVDLQQALSLLPSVDGVMIGRAAYHNPYLLSQADWLFFQDNHPIPTREQILESYMPYIEARLSEGIRLHSMLRHLSGLYHGQPGARLWRRHLSEQGNRPEAGSEVLKSWLAKRTAMVETADV